MVSLSDCEVVKRVQNTLSWVKMHTALYRPFRATKFVNGLIQGRRSCVACPWLSYCAPLALRTCPRTWHSNQPARGMRAVGVEQVGTRAVGVGQVGVRAVGVEVGMRTITPKPININFEAGSFSLAVSFIGSR